MTPNLTLDLPTLPTGPQAPTAGAGPAFPAAPDPSLVVSAPTSAPSALRNLSSNTQSGVAPITNSSAAGQALSIITSIPGAATIISSSSSSGAEGRGVTSALSTIPSPLSGLFGHGATTAANSAASVSKNAEVSVERVVAGSVTSSATAALRGFAGFRPWRER